MAKTLHRRTSRAPPPPVLRRPRPMAPMSSPVFCNRIVPSSFLFLGFPSPSALSVASSLLPYSLLISIQVSEDRRARPLPRHADPRAQEEAQLPYTDGSAPPGLDAEIIHAQQARQQQIEALRAQYAALMAQQDHGPPSDLPYATSHAQAPQAPFRPDTSGPMGASYGSPPPRHVQQYPSPAARTRPPHHVGSVHHTGSRPQSAMSMRSEERVPLPSIATSHAHPPQQGLSESHLPPWLRDANVPAADATSPIRRHGAPPAAHAPQQRITVVDSDAQQARRAKQEQLRADLAQQIADKQRKLEQERSDLQRSGHFQRGGNPLDEAWGAIPSRRSISMPDDHGSVHAMNGAHAPAYHQQSGPQGYPQASHPFDNPAHQHNPYASSSHPPQPQSPPSHGTHQHYQSHGPAAGPPALTRHGSRGAVGGPAHVDIAALSKAGMMSMAANADQDAKQFEQERRKQALMQHQADIRRQIEAKEEAKRQERENAARLEREENERLAREQAALQQRYEAEQRAAADKERAKEEQARAMEAAIAESRRRADEEREEARRLRQAQAQAEREAEEQRRQQAELEAEVQRHQQAEREAEEQRRRQASRPSSQQPTEAFPQPQPPATPPHSRRHARRANHTLVAQERGPSPPTTVGSGAELSRLDDDEADVVLTQASPPRPWSPPIPTLAAQPPSPPVPAIAKQTELKRELQPQPRPQAPSTSVPAQKIREAPPVTKSLAPAPDHAPMSAPASVPVDPRIWEACTALRTCLKEKQRDIAGAISTCRVYLESRGEAHAVAELARSQVAAVLTTSSEA
ncbi:uncharacterized protein MONBRDRAFT_27332 [Monosiga brevicollis MX1]|uniref:Uncharacterized protein n=1 Tax=Monosiga brevicollis TaxID=81824 RepID=A9V4Z5_MONBE|nr:uncharacterized protein MONBRDRAFT_27332 [Monosiga brevicollis MX1]EDQ87541.1 predicted protein [Monosiga brevicollis MX1]|eukprot:XP_001747801.1 hypothetical protein [Monosiga brevicollis MX1]